MTRRAVAVLVLLLAVGCGSKQAPARRAARTPVVMILGDSYTVGRKGQLPERTYAAETARMLGWQVILGGYRGTGFLAPGSIGKNFAKLYAEQLAWRPRPDQVIVSGGHNDWRYPPEQVADAAHRLLATIQQHWPGTRVVFLGPMWGGDPVPRVLAVRDALARTAGDLVIPFIDPLHEHWITGVRARDTGNSTHYILPDGTHPTAEGARYIARRFAADLRTRALLP